MHYWPSWCNVFLILLCVYIELYAWIGGHICAWNGNALGESLSTTTIDLELDTSHVQLSTVHLLTLMQRNYLGPDEICAGLDVWHDEAVFALVGAQFIRRPFVVGEAVGSDFDPDGTAPIGRGWSDIDLDWTFVAVCNDFVATGAMGPFYCDLIASFNLQCFRRWSFVLVADHILALDILDWIVIEDLADVRAIGISTAHIFAIDGNAPHESMRGAEVDEGERRCEDHGESHDGGFHE